MSELPIIGMDGDSAVIADLHLDPFDEAACNRFRRWTQGLACVRFLVLGDLFDAWVGPAHESAPGSQQVIGAFKDLGQRGIAVHVLQGNRDFLLGASFERATGCQVHGAGLLGALPGGQRILFLHGDELCTLDLPYQRLRRITHSFLVQRIGPLIPLFISRRIAARLRRYSKRAVSMKLSGEKEIQESAAQESLTLVRAQTLVCGHVHRSRDQAMERGGRWLILDAWEAGEQDLLAVTKGTNLTLVASAGFSAPPSVL